MRYYIRCARRNAIAAARTKLICQFVPVVHASCGAVAAVRSAFGFYLDAAFVAEIDCVTDLSQIIPAMHAARGAIASIGLGGRFDFGATFADRKSVV